MAIDRNYAALQAFIHTADPNAIYFAAVQSPELRNVREYAEANAQRAFSLPLLPARAATFAGKEQALVTLAMSRMPSSLNDISAILKEVEKVKELQKQRQVTVEFIGGTDETSILQNLIVWYGNLVATQEDKLLEKGTDVLFAATIVMAYTLVETTADDLWVAAVNGRPKTLASNVIKRRAGEDRPAKLQEPSITLRELSDYGFNVSENMGDFLAAANRVSLDTVKRTMDAYRDAFWNPHHPKSYKRCVELDAIFDEFESDLFILERLRNMLVHQGGKIDDVFFEQIRYKKDHGLGQITENDVGKKLLLNGETVVRYTVCALNFSRKLLSFVDDWLVKYPDPQCPPPKNCQS